MIRIGIDPGVRECGVAIEFPDMNPALGVPKYQALVIRADLPTLAERAKEMAWAASQSAPEGSIVKLCVEWQQIYPSERSKGDPNDMIGVAIVAGAMLGAFGVRCTVIDTELPLPRQWKGGTPKKIHHARIARDYPHWVEPVQRYTPKSLQNHVWDAVGLLEWHRERSET